MDNKTVEGYLHKWTNYLKGYQRRYFVLQDGLLSYYRNTAEITRICRGTINIISVKISVLENNCFTISHSNIPNLHLRAPNENELNRWTKAIIAAQNKAKDLRRDFALNDNEVDSIEYFTRSLSLLKYQLDDVKENNELLNNKFDDLLRSISDLERDKNIALYSDGIMKIKTVKERATICRVTLAKSICAQNDYTNSFTKESDKTLKVFERESEQKQRLEVLVEQLGKQLRNLEKTIQKKKQNSMISRKSIDLCSEASEDHFYDAYDTQDISDSHLTNADISHSSNVINRSMLRHVGGASTTSSGTQRRVSDFSLEYESDVEDIPSDESDRDDYFNTPTQRSLHQSFGDMELKTVKDDLSTVKRKISSSNRSSTTESSKHPNSSKNIKTKDRNKEMTISTNNAINNGVISINATTTIDLVKFNNIPIREERKRRSMIPPKPNFSMNLWSVVKNSIGKDLSKIPMPVNFSEPISMLQRLAEDFEYSKILDKAASLSNPIEQLPYIAAFTVSSYAATALRVNKPFNPLLGETYELDRTDDLGWRLTAEQCKHHPPECAVHCESNEWKCWFKFSMTNKFRGKYLQIDPIGKSHLVFKRSQCHYVWEKVPMTIHNIIVGKIWIDNHGEIDIINCTTGDKCHLSYKAYSMFSADVPRRVTGLVTDKMENAHFVLNGTWDEKLEARKIISISPTNPKSKNAFETEKEAILLWERSSLLKDSDKIYFFTLFSLSLNEMEEGIAPTDSRHRPDQRLMEEGRWEEANKEKTRLEEEQRSRKVMIINHDGSKELGYEYNPLWFDKVVDPDTKTEMMLFNGRYWESKQRQDWSKCIQLF